MIRWSLAFLAAACPGPADPGTTDPPAETATPSPASPTVEGVPVHPRGDAGCVAPSPLLTADGWPTGFVRCADGSTDRVQAVPSDPTADRIPACDGADGYDDAACADAPRGLYYSMYGCSWPHCVCTYPCAQDTDCGPGFACLPPEAHGGGIDWPTCIPATCLTDADCPSGECGLGAVDSCDGTSYRLDCRTPDDACRVPEDCPENSPLWKLCSSGGGAWECQYWIDAS